MRTKRDRSEDLFVIRIWSEPSADGQAPWRAFVTHTSTGEREYFTSYAQLFAFLEHYRTERAARG